MLLFTVILAVVTIVAIALALVSRRRVADLRRERDAVAAAVGTASDPHEVVPAVRELQSDVSSAEASASMFESALDGVPAGVVHLSRSGAIMYANPGARAFLEESREGAVLTSRVSALGHRVGASGVAETVEMDVHEPERRVLSVTATPAMGPAAEGSTFVYIEDLSERRRVDAMRADFVANASHELKTPLGALSLLAEALADSTNEESRVRLGERLRSEAARMAHVIDDVVQLAETQSLGTEYEEVLVREVIDRAEAAVRPQAVEQDIDLVREDVADRAVVGDRQQLTSAVTNLLANAITYTAVKGEPGTVRFGARSSPASVALWVSDTGIGIPARYRDRVFERFFRVDRARSRESGGTGLGLSIVRNIAIAHGGTVSVESDIGVGSTFTIELPSAKEAS